MTEEARKAHAPIAVASGGWSGMRKPFVAALRAHNSTVVRCVRDSVQPNLAPRDGFGKEEFSVMRARGLTFAVAIVARMAAISVPLLLRGSLSALTLSTAPCAMAQLGPSGPPVVGVVTVERKPMIESYEFNGRIAAIDNVNIVARVTAFLEKQLFVEGSDVKSGDLIYTLERPPFQAAVDAQNAAVAQAQAQLDNANISLWRAQQLVDKAAGTQKAVDDALAAQRAAAAQLKSAQAQLETAQINLDYTEIHAPVNGRIGRTSVTVGNVVSPSSGTLTTVVRQDPMHVIFPVPTRRALELREQYADKGGFDAVKIRIRLPDGRIYGQTGKLDFVDNTIGQDTDSLTMRGVIPNPVVGSQSAGGVKLRELVADEFVTVLVESVKPRDTIAVPRAAVLADQRGTYVYVVDQNNVARQRYVRVGESTPEIAAVVDGLTVGESIVVDGIQRVRPDAPVAPAPAAPSPVASSGNG
jgi:membrane fusion protein, multidrug efflux system